MAANCLFKYHLFPYFWSWLTGLSQGEQRWGLDSTAYPVARWWLLTWLVSLGSGGSEVKGLAQAVQLISSEPQA